MTACKRHSESPVKGYNQCAGCEIEALLAENKRLSRCLATANGQAERFEREWYLRGDELEAARVLLRYASSAMAREGMESALVYEIDTFLTDTPAPEVPDHTERNLEMVEQGAITVERDFVGTMHIKVGDFDAVQVRYQYPYTDNASTRRLAERIADMLQNPLAEQGERQEAVEVVVPAKLTGATGFSKGIENGWNAAIDAVLRLNASPQPCQDVRGLAASLYQACGAYDMPERILDALSAAANGEPFAHMIDGLLPCVPPSGEGVQSLVEALEECAASLAWNCFGECRAIHAGPIMPAAKALDTARAALAAHRQAQRQA